MTLQVMICSYLFLRITQDCKRLIPSIPSAVSNQPFKGIWNILLTDMHIRFPKLASWIRFNLNCIKPYSDWSCIFEEVLWLWLAKQGLGCLHFKSTPSLGRLAQIIVPRQEQTPVQKAAPTPDSFIVNCLINSVCKDYCISERECSETRYKTQQKTSDKIPLPCDSVCYLLGYKILLCLVCFWAQIQKVMCFVVILNVRTQ